MTEPGDYKLAAIRRRWSRDGGMGNERSVEDYTDAGCRILARHAFGDVAALLARVAELEQANERLHACDCAASEDGNPHHQGYCRSLPTSEKRERAKRTALTIAQLSEHGRDSNVLAGELAGVRDELAAARTEIEDWRDKWAMVDADRGEAQDRAERAEAQVRAVEALIRDAESSSIGWLPVTLPHGAPLSMVKTADLRAALGGGDE